MYTLQDVSILIGVKEASLAAPVLQSLSPLSAKVIIGNGVINSFSKLINHCICNAENDIVVILSHRVRPTREHIQFMVDKINEGYIMASLYRWACVAFHKSLIDLIGFLDERFPAGGCEDIDFYNRMKICNIGMYDKSAPEWIQYDFSEKSSWNPNSQKNIDIFNFKWQKTKENRNVMYNYKYTPIKKEFINYKKWYESYLSSFSVYYIEMSSIYAGQLHINPYDQTAQYRHINGKWTQE